MNSIVHTFMHGRTVGPSTNNGDARDAAVETRDRCDGCGIAWSTAEKHTMRPVSLIAITCKSLAKHCTTAHDTKHPAMQDLEHVPRDLVVSNFTLSDGHIEAKQFEKFARVHVKLAFVRN